MAGAAVVQDEGRMDEFLKFLLYPAAFMLTLYLQVIRNRQYRIVMEMWLGIFLLFTFLFADRAFSSYVESGGDIVSVHVFRLLLVALLAQTTAVHLTKASPDPAVDISVTIINILMRGNLLVCMVYGLWKIQFAGTMAIMILTPVIIGDILHFYKATSMVAPSSVTVGDPISWHLSIDAMVSFILGAGLLGFPDLLSGVLHSKCSPDEVYCICTKAYGSLIVSGSVLSFASLSFKTVEDATSILISKLVLYLPTLLMTVTDYKENKNVQGHGCCSLVMGLIVGALAFNVGYAICRPEKRGSNAE